MKFAIPTVGSKISVTTRFRSVTIFAKSPFNDTTHTGEVIKSEKWMNADSFCLRTGNPKYPVSIITLERVIDLKVLEGKTTNIRKFRVKGSQDYVVILSGNNYSCDCVGFKYYAKCKHITAVKNSLENKHD